MNAALCSCGETKPHIIARRSTASGTNVCLWDDGTLTWPLGAAVRGAWFKPSPANRPRALRAGWLVLGEVEIVEDDRVTALCEAARWAAERDGLPGTVRARLHRARSGLKPSWEVTRTDARGRATERVWTFHRLSPWAGHAVWDYCSSGRGGRYEIHALLPAQRGLDGSRSRDVACTPTGLRFETQQALLAWMSANPPTVAP